MKNYLNYKVDTKNPDLISVIDELPLWSAPFGLKLLEVIKLKKHINVLDIGCGLGFPLVELSQRLGSSCNIYGIDLWPEVLDRAKLKLKVYGIENVKLFNSAAEEMPFENEFFDLIVSNNGINNVQDLPATLNEVFRVSKPESQFVFSMNTENTMKEFYNEFEIVLTELNLLDEVGKMKDQIYSKRKPIREIRKLLKKSGFEIDEIHSDLFEIRFIDGTAMFNHYLIKCWFLDGWKDILSDKDMETVFDKVEKRLNVKSEEKGICKLTVPFLVFDCNR